MAVKSVKFLSFLVMAINLFNQRSLRKSLTNARTLQTDPTYCPSSRLVKPAFHIFKPFFRVLETKQKPVHRRTQARVLIGFENSTHERAQSDWLVEQSTETRCRRVCSASRLSVRSF